MSTPSEYIAPSAEDIAEFCEVLRRRMTEASRRSTLTWSASFGEHEVLPHAPFPLHPRYESDGSWEVTIRAGAVR